MEMIRLNRGMMSRWEIPDTRPQRTENLIFGAEAEMLIAAHLLREGSACVTARAESLNAQDGMFTLLARGEEKNEEIVVQKILRALHPETDFDAFLALAKEKSLARLVLRAEEADVRLALAARFLYARFEAELPAPEILLISELPSDDDAESFSAAVRLISAKWSRAEAFFAWLNGAKILPALLDGLFGFMDARECAIQQQKMNYTDEFLLWSEPEMRLTTDADADRHARIFGTAAALSAGAGWFFGFSSFAEAMRDADLRRWIGRAFTEEILPNLPWKREEIAADVISAFERLENPANAAPILGSLPGKNLMKRLPRTILPSVRAYAEENFDAPPMLSLGVAALIMLYSGVRRDESGAYAVQRGDQTHRICDDYDILETFSKFAHDMPAESLAYAALADRGLWSCDLRQIDGLEARIAADLSSIQRIGFRATLKNRLETV